MDGWIEGGKDSEIGGTDRLAREGKLRRGREHREAVRVAEPGERQRVNDM